MDAVDLLFHRADAAEAADASGAAAADGERRRGPEARQKLEAVLLGSRAGSPGHTQREPDEPESPPPAAEPRAPSLKPGSGIKYCGLNQALNLAARS